jgi:hypothetical protein
VARSGGSSLLAFLITVSPGVASAAGFRHRFEPTDLELEDPGTLEADMQFGATTGDGAGRVYVPDYEIDFGLSPRVEVDLDGAMALEPLSSAPKLAFGEPLWASTKIGIIDLRDEGATNAAAFGVQLGPRIPVGGDLHGVGYQVLTLTGVNARPVHLVINAGALVDPSSTSSRRRPYGFVGGLDLVVDLDSEKRWSATGELGGVLFIAEAPSQLTATLGLTFSPSSSLDLSMVLLTSPFGPTDQVGALLGISPRVSFF